jgi:hypothetical protein
MTAEELLRMPSIEFRCELVKGELIKMPFAEAEEGFVAGNI